MIEACKKGTRDKRRATVSDRPLPVREQARLFQSLNRPFASVRVIPDAHRYRRGRNILSERSDDVR